MPSVSQIGFAPVKSGSLASPDEVEVGPHGIVGDRRFMVLRHDGRPLRQTEKAWVIGVRFAYDHDTDTLTATFPDGRVVEGNARDTGASIVVDHHGFREISCHELRGPWPDSLSAHAGRPVTLARIDDADLGAIDVLPITLLTTASMRRLDREAGKQVDPKRFRSSFVISGTPEHAEDTWEDRTLEIGQARLRVHAGVPRCAVTSLHPATGARDLNVLKVLTRYRPLVGIPGIDTSEYRSISFAVYATVEKPGRVAVGDAVTVL